MKIEQYLNKFKGYLVTKLGGVTAEDFSSFKTSCEVWSLANLKTTSGNEVLTNMRGCFVEGDLILRSNNTSAEGVCVTGEVKVAPWVDNVVVQNITSLESE